MPKWGMFFLLQSNWIKKIVLLYLAQPSTKLQLNEIMFVKYECILNLEFNENFIWF